MKNELIKLLRESTLVQGAMALTLTATICVMYLMGSEVPNELLMVLTSILGYYFGSKTQSKLMKGE